MLRRKSTTKLFLLVLCLIFLTILCYRSYSAPKCTGATNRSTKNPKTTRQHAENIWRLVRAETKSRDLANRLKPLFAALATDTNEETSPKNDVAAAKLRRLVRNRFETLQNPPSDTCADTRELVCDVNKDCGLGCQLHHVAYCFALAYGTRRRLVVDSRPWNYVGPWDRAFEPVSNTCVGAVSRRRRTVWYDDVDARETRVVKAPIFESLDSRRPRPPFIPLAVPVDLVDAIRTFHRRPSVWWIGQMMGYLFRPNERVRNRIEALKERLGFGHPIVGVHVRRTDKIGWEADLHQLHEYMEGVSEYYEMLEWSKPVEKKLVFLATDDTDVWEKAKETYKDYVFLHDENASRSAKKNRFSLESLEGAVSDIVLLSDTDYLICTFSSQVCRLAYELMQTKHTDASDKVLSLDDVYYFGGQETLYWRAVENHVPPENDRSQIRLEVGDLVTVEKMGPVYWFGKNQRTKERGLYPSFKVEEKTLAGPFPVF